MQVSKWGNSLAVRLPAALAQAMGLKEGDEVTLVPQPADSSETPVLAVARNPTRQEAIDALRQYEGLLPSEYRFKREDAYDD